MARKQNIVTEVFIFILYFILSEGKIFSDSLGEFRIFRKPDVVFREEVDYSRHKRSISHNGTNLTEEHGYFHSQNLTLSSSTFSLNGVNDNEVFVHWTGPKNDTVFVITRSHRDGQIQSCTLWRSTDYGEKYSKVALSEKFLIHHMYSSRVNKTVTILSDLMTRQLYVTQDTGETWTLVQLEFSPYRMLLHPSASGLVLAYSLREMKLFVSEDFGLSWALMRERVTERFFWAVDGVDKDIRAVHMEIQDVMGLVRYDACIAPECEPVLVDDSIGTIDFYSLVVENEYIFVQKSIEDNTTMHVSYKRGPFRKAYFPSGSQPLDFNIVDTNDQQVFIAVDHADNQANLYVSDITGQFYVHSMENLVGMRYPGKFDVDLIKIQGLSGTYIINKFEASRTEGGVFQQRTYITWNKGGNWTLLDVPQESKGLCPEGQSCNLHLHIGNTNRFFHIPLAVSKEEAPGLILAHGSVGTYINLDTHVYISRDAGKTWRATPFYGNHFLNIMDQGSAISAISAELSPTNQVHFSCTEGATWNSHIFSDTDMNVDGVVNEPGIRSLISSVFGHKNSSEGWVIVKMDFASVLPRKCSQDDFEEWNPVASHPYIENKCVMGEELVFERRKQMSECYYGEDYHRPKSSKACGCERQDFECDFGYKQGSDGITCEKSAWFNFESLPAPVCVYGKYNRSAGYRKSAANKCVGGHESQYNYIETDCPLLAPQGLQIVVERNCVPRGANVTFSLKQESGSEEETMYTWSFGNGSSPVTIKGLQAASVMTHRFTVIGSYNVSVTAVNSKGRDRATLTLNVEDELKNVLVEIPWGARTGTPSYFNVTVLGSNNASAVGTESRLHFAWQFENQHTGSYRQLTWQNVLEQKFTHPGEYTLTLSVFNSVSSVFYTQSVEVYEDATTVRLHFSDQINNYNSSSLNVRLALAEILCHNLAQILEIRRTRIIMSVQPFMPVVGDVTILPAKPNSNESETFKVVEMLIEQAKEQYLAFPLFTSDDIVIITDAGILNLTSGEESTTLPPPPRTVTVTVQVPINVTMVTEKHSLVAVYVSVPVLIAVVIIAAVMILYYRKKLKSDRKYVPIVKHHRIHHDSTCSCGDDDFQIEDPEFTIIPDQDFEDSEPQLMILNEPISDRNGQRSLLP